MTAWSIAPVIDWLMHKGRHIASPEALVADLRARVRAAGLPIERAIEVYAMPDRALA